MAEARTLEAERRRHLGIGVSRKKGPLEKAPGKNLVKEAKGLMDRAVRLRNTDVREAMRAAESAAGFYLVASDEAFSKRVKAECLVCVGKALSLMASLCKEGDPRRAGRVHNDAGNNFLEAARGGAEPKGKVLEMAKEQFSLALQLGGDAKILNRKIAICARI